MKCKKILPRQGYLNVILHTPFNILKNLTSMLHATTAESQHTQEDMLPMLLKCLPSKKWLLTIETILAIVELEPVEEASILKGPS